MPPQGHPLPAESWPARFWETDGWSGYEADPRSGKIPVASSRKTRADGSSATGEEKWWHVSDQQLESLLQRIGNADTLDEILRVAAQGESSNRRPETPDDESKELTARPHQLELSNRTLPLKSPRRIRLIIHFIESGDELELTVPLGLQLALASPSSEAPPVALADDRPGRALRALLAPPPTGDQQPLSARSRQEKQTLKGILAQLVDMDADGLRFYSKGVPLLGLVKGDTLQSLGVRDGDVLSLQLRHSRGVQPPPLHDVLSRRLRKAAAWDAKLRPRWRWSERPNLFKPLGSKSNHPALNTPRDFSSYGPYEPERKHSSISPRLRASLQTLSP